MSKFYIGDLVVLKSGSMRMCVEDVAEDDTVAVVWCHEGVIGRERFSTALLNKWEFREDQGGRGGDRGGPRGGGGRPYGGDREGGGRPYGGGRGGGHGGDDRGPRGGGDRHDDRPRKQGWDGKPRQKNHFRNDD